MSLGRTFFVSCFLWKVMILLCCYSSSTSHISIRRLDHGFSVFQVCSKVRKRYEWGIGKSRSGMLYWRSLWLPIQCYIETLWRMLSTQFPQKSPGKVVKAEVFRAQLSFQDFISDPRVKAWTRQEQLWPSTFLKMLRLKHQSLFQNPLMVYKDLWEGVLQAVVQSPFLWFWREMGRCSRLKKWRRDREH